MSTIHLDTTQPRYVWTPDERRIPALAVVTVTTYLPHEPGRAENGGDYAGGMLIAKTAEGVQWREWDSSDWDDRHRWGAVDLPFWYAVRTAYQHDRGSA